MNNLDSDLLRTFLAVAMTGSVTDGAARIHRSQSAVSLQLKKLEDTVGNPLFDRHGRGVRITSTGERLLPVAHDVIRTLDATLLELQSDELQGVLRLGIPDNDRTLLSTIIGEFSQSHPSVEIEVQCAPCTDFPNALVNAELDLAVYEVEQVTESVEVLRKEKTCWMMSRHHDLLSRDPLPVALFDKECWWRDKALASLKATGREFRIVFSSQSDAGVAAAVEAGIAIGLLGNSSINLNLKPLGAEHGFDETLTSTLVLASRRDSQSLTVEAMKNAIRHAFSVGK